MLRPAASATASSQFPRPRTLIHPGPFNPVRIQSKHSERGRHIRLALQPGLSLFDALVKPLAEVGVKNASTTILGGFFAELQYCVAPPDPSHKAVIAYTQPIRAGRAYMIFGNATLGKDAQGITRILLNGRFVCQDGPLDQGKTGPRVHKLGELGEDISHLVTPLPATDVDDDLRVGPPRK